MIQPLLAEMGLFGETKDDIICAVFLTARDGMSIYVQDMIGMSSCF